MYSIDIRVIQYFIRLVLLFGIYSLFRLLFVGFNWNLFEDLTLFDFIIGIRFDAVSIALLFLPFHFFSIVGLWWNHKILHTALLWFLYLGLTISIALSAIDLKYFEFTLKRTTSDVFQFFEPGGDAWALIPSFIIDFWYIFFITALLFYGSFKLFRSTMEINTKNFEISNWKQRVFFSVFIFGFATLLGRGGAQLIPLKIMDGTKFTSPSKVPVVLNTPFTIIRTFGKTELPRLDYYTEVELEQAFNPIKVPGNSNEEPFKRLNVIVITLESFSNEFVLSDRNEYLTPFFNELKRKSLSFENCYANGKRSIEGIPAIFSSLPSLGEHPVSSSLYARNTLRSLAYYLGKENYNSSFFHGGKNGTMNFDAYCKTAGFDSYFGKNEYPTANDYDGAWGIYDEPFYDFFLNQISSFKQPFFSGFFSLSSHHPYSIPDQYKKQFNQGRTPMENSIAYADYALKTFFEKAKKESWYNNTLFVITADHTPSSKHKFYKNNLGQFDIPLLFFCPSDSNLTGKNYDISQQTDVLPSILDYLNYQNPYFAFGESVFDSTRIGYSIQYINGSYQFISNDYLLQFNNNEAIALYDISKDQMLSISLLSNEKVDYRQQVKNLKAIVQQYNTRMIDNRLSE